MKVRILFLICLFPAFLFAGFPKVGTTSAPFLKIGVGARAVALGDNYTALANDASALYWNPAGITSLNRISISANHTSWFAGITHDAVLVAIPVGDAMAFGVDLTYLSSGDIEQTTLEEQEGTGIFYDATDFALGFTYAQKLTDRFSVAVKGKYISQKIYNETASTFAVDFGTIYQTDFKGLRIGMNMANFGGNMQMAGNDLVEVKEDPYTGSLSETVRNTESWPLPIIFRVGVAVDILGANDGFIIDPANRITFAMDAMHPNDNNETIGAGLEYEWNEFLALRAGYKANHEIQNLSIGGGLHFVLSGVHFNIDYAYADFGDLDAIQRFTARFAF